MIYTRTITASSEPISISDARDHLRLLTVNGSHPDDYYIEQLIVAAREKVEHDTKRCIVASTFLGYLDAFPYGNILIQQSPVSSVTEIAIKNSAGTYVTWDATNYDVDTVSNPARIMPTGSWEYTDGDLLNMVRISFVAGYATPALVPQSIKQAMEYLIGHWYENRQEVIVGTAVKEVPVAYENLMRMNSVDRF